MIIKYLWRKGIGGCENRFCSIKNSLLVLLVYTSAFDRYLIRTIMVFFLLNFLPVQFKISKKSDQSPDSFQKCLELKVRNRPKIEFRIGWNICSSRNLRSLRLVSLLIRICRSGRQDEIPPSDWPDENLPVKIFVPMTVNLSPGSFEVTFWLTIYDGVYQSVLYFYI